MRNSRHSGHEQEARCTIFEELDAAYRELKADSQAWQQELEERRFWEAMLMDGLEDEPWEG